MGFSCQVVVSVSRSVRRRGLFGEHILGCELDVEKGRVNVDMAHQSLERGQAHPGGIMSLPKVWRKRWGLACWTPVIAR